MQMPALQVPPSPHGAVLLTLLQPFVGSQESSVQGLLSSHETAV